MTKRTTKTGGIVSPKTFPKLDTAGRDRVFQNTTFTITVDYSDEPRQETVTTWWRCKERMQALRKDYDARGVEARIWAIAEKAYMVHIFDNATGEEVFCEAFETQEESEQYDDKYRETIDMGDHDVRKYSVYFEIVKAPTVRRKRQKKVHQGYISPLAGIFGYRKMDGY